MVPPVRKARISPNNNNNNNKYHLALLEVLKAFKLGSSRKVRKSTKKA
jgi:hypothetical protein